MIAELCSDAKSSTSSRCSAPCKLSVVVSICCLHHVLLAGLLLRELTRLQPVVTTAVLFNPLVVVLAYTAACLIHCEGGMVSCHGTGQF